MVVVDRESLAWAAGYFDGDGCFTVTEQVDGARGVWIKAVLHGTDRELVERFARTVGVGRVRAVRGATDRRKPVWGWQVASYEGVQAVGALLWTWLGSYRRDQLAKVLRAGSTHRRHLQCANGHPYGPESFSAGRRRCAICASASQARRDDRKRLARVSQ